MQLRPEAGRGRFLAVALLLIVLVLLGWAVHDFFIAPHLEVAEQLAKLREEEARFRAVAAQAPAVQKQLAEVQAFEAGNPAFLEEKDFDAAAANLTQRLKQMVAAHARDPQSCQIVMNQYNRQPEQELFERASIKVRLRCSWEEFAPILYDIENSSPMLFLDEFQVWKQIGYRMPGSPQAGGFLDINFTLSGYLRNRPVPPATAAAKRGGA